MAIQQDPWKVSPAAVPAQADVSVQEPPTDPTQEGTGYTPRIGQDDIRKAADTLRRYKDAKGPLEERIVEDEQWYKLQHWDYIARKDGREAFDAKSGYGDSPHSTSAWLLNTIAAKHADAMDNFPQPDVLPRAEDDKQTADQLSVILPAVLEHTDFESVYSDNWWEKLKHGTALYGVFWDPAAENGLGDVAIKRVDLLNLFWEPGCTDLQKSRNLFLVDAVDNDILEQQYPQVKGKLGGDVIEIKDYIHGWGEETKDSAQEKSLVVDWYYKLTDESGKTRVHLCKFVGDNLLYASQNDPAYAEGWYEHGKYPFVADVLFPEKDTPVGFGEISITKNPQMMIDRLGNDLMINAQWCSRPRYFSSERAGVNEDEFRDASKQVVHCAGDIDDDKLKPISVPGIDTYAITLLQQKIDELKETSSNRDVNNGGTGSATAAAAISAMQEAGNKISRDMIASSYRAYKEIDYLCIELMRQFYTEQRYFRITGDDGGYQFASFDNSGIQPQPMPEAYAGQYAAEEPAMRLPIFDIVIKPEKKNPYSRLTQMEYAKEFYQLGFFDPTRAQESIGALNMMEFDGKSEVLKYVQQGQTLYDQVQKLSAALQAITGVAAGGTQPAAQQGTQPSPGRIVGNGQTQGSAAVSAAKANMTPYAEKLASRAAVNAGSTGAVQK